jgi:tetratricopeptide (TPR) repeat protein
MKKLISIILPTLIMLVSSYLFLFADDSVTIVNQANNLYRQKKFDQAIKLYNQAQIKSPDSAEINYNIGIAWFKKEDYNAAISFLEKATASKDKILESKANFNIANAKYKLGRLKENTGLKETISLLRQSLDYYKRAIELDPQDQDAKINHELVEKELKILLDKLKQEQDQQKDEQQENKQEPAKQEQEAGQQKQEDQQVQEQQEPGQAEDVKEMSKEEAKMLLEGYRQEENASGMLKDDRKGGEGKVLKDW